MQLVVCSETPLTSGISSRCCPWADSPCDPIYSPITKNPRRIKKEFQKSSSRS